MFETRVTISVRQLLFALILFGMVLAMFSIAQGQPTEAAPQTESVPAWTVYLKPYGGAASQAAGYLVNVVTGEVYYLKGDDKQPLKLKK